MKLLRLFLSPLLLFLLPHIIEAQSDSTSLKSIEGITNRMLEIISVPIGEDPDWDEYRNLFIPTNQKLSLRPDGPPGRQLRDWNLEEFIRQVGPLYGRDGFKEVAIGLTINEYNGIATAFQVFHAKNLLGTYDKRGINCFQLAYMDGRWWIVNSIFVSEDPENPIPEKYLSPR